MDKFIYHRLAGNGLMFFLLSITTLLTWFFMMIHLPHHPELKLFHSLSFRYATIWNVLVQLSYSVLAFTCDYYTVKNKTEMISPAVRNFRFRIFYEIVFPNCMCILIFWPIYFFDRELIFPIVTEIVAAQWQSIVAHALVLVYVAWEMAFLPMDVPNRREIKVTPIIVIQTAYIINVLYSKYVQPGAWVYDILGYLEGSFSFYPVFFSPIIFSVTGFYLQWFVKDCLFKLRDMKLKVR